MQNYHKNATTNLHFREQINNSFEKNSVLSEKFNVNIKTIRKWKGRDSLEDKSSRPHTIHYVLQEAETALVVVTRKETWMSLDDLHDMMLLNGICVSRSTIHRTLCRNNINTVPQEKREQAKKFKEYEPGFLHIDVTYLPEIDGKKHYLFVAIDRATRLLFYEIYPEKTAQNAEIFLKNCKNFFPFIIKNILTDNGLEFTNRLIKSKKGENCTKQSRFDLECQKDQINHRLTKPHTPQTNGMVERVNGTIKNATILNTRYLSYDEMKDDLLKFLIYYNTNRKHGSLKKELHVRTPMDAVKKWHELKPEIFHKTPCQLEKYIVDLHNEITQKSPQRCET